MALYGGETYLQRAALAAGADTVALLPPDLTLLKNWLAQTHPPSSSLTTAVLGSKTDDLPDMTAMLMHDLKSPISIIISTLEVVVATCESDETMVSMLKLLRGALAAAYRQMYLITDMLDMVRLDLLTYELECHPCNLVEVVKDFIADESTTLTEKKIRLEMELPDIPLVANVDAKLVWRMCWALLDNVLKFTIHDDLLRISGGVDGENVVIHFTDSGRPVMAGFEHQVLQHAPRWSDRQAGTRTSVAMGLPFVHAAAKAQGGSIRVHSDPVSKLTNFTLVFPQLKTEGMGTNGRA
jgi:K+-sensing histidine kinase KdpD